MTRFTHRRIALATVGAGGVLALAFAVPNLAFAQDPAADSASPSTTASAKPDPAGDRAKRQDELATALAKELGIDKDKVAAALAKVESARQANRPKPSGTPGPGRPGADANHGADLKARLAAAVSAGKLTQAEADAIVKASDAGVLGPAGGPGGRPPGK